MFSLLALSLVRRIFCVLDIVNKLSVLRLEFFRSDVASCPVEVDDSDGRVVSENHVRRSEIPVVDAGLVQLVDGVEAGVAVSADNDP